MCPNPKDDPTSNDNNAVNNENEYDRQQQQQEEEEKKWKVYETQQDTGIIPTLGVAMWLGWMGVLVYSTLYIIIFAGSLERTIYIACCTTLLFLPRRFPDSIGRRIGKWSMTQAEKYFGLKTTFEDHSALLSLSQSNKSVIFAHEPHDILPYPVFCYSPYINRLPGLIGSRCCALVTSAVFYLPVIRQVYSWTCCEPVDKTTFSKKLERKESFVFCPGGVQEVTMMEGDEVLLYLKSRKGFIKLALMAGTPIVPSFSFNTDGSYGYWIPKSKFVNRLARRIGFLPMVFWGRFGIPFGIPYPQKIHVVVGKPIVIPKLEKEKISDEIVNEYHALFLREIEALYDRHKAEAGYSHRKLRIV